MTSWHTQFGRSNPIQPTAITTAAKSSSVAFPMCNMRGGLCETLLSALPMAIIVIQFIRDGYEVVQDGVITLANESAASAFASGQEQLTGSLFLSNCSAVLPFGAWHRCLWVASSGKSESLIFKSEDGKNQQKSLTIAPYGDGLLLALSVQPLPLTNIHKPEVSHVSTPNQP